MYAGLFKQQFKGIVGSVTEASIGSFREKSIPFARVPVFNIIKVKSRQRRRFDNGRGIIITIPRTSFEPIPLLSPSFA